MIVLRPWRRLDLETALDFVAARTGLSFPESRREIAEAAVRRAARQEGVRTPSAYLDSLRAGGESFDRLVAELTVGETYFFRDPAQLDFVSREVLPRAGRRTGPIRAWSAGCATGEEAYSIAILLDQLDLLARASVIGTDVAEPRLARAREAAYGEWSLRGCPESLLRAYFEKAGRSHALVPRIRRAVRFENLNLGEPDFLQARPHLRDMDLVLCRNVLIYMDPATVERVGRELLGALAPDGWLLLGASDPPLHEIVPCHVEITEAGLAYQRRRTVARASSHEAERSAGSRAAAGNGPVGEPGRRRRSSYPARRRPPTRRAAPSPQDGEPAEMGEAAMLAWLRELLNGSPPAETEALRERMTRGRSSSAEVAYLRSVLLMEWGRHVEAARAAREALYLDRGFTVAYLSLARALERAGDHAGAERALRNAAAALSALDPDAPVRGADGELAGNLLGLTRARMRLLGAREAS